MAKSDQNTDNLVTRDELQTALSGMVAKSDFDALAARLADYESIDAAGQLGDLTRKGDELAGVVAEAVDNHETRLSALENNSAARNTPDDIDGRHLSYIMDKYYANERPPADWKPLRRADDTRADNEG